jgi:hypothetical protein
MSQLMSWSKSSWVSPVATKHPTQRAQKPFYGQRHLDVVEDEVESSACRHSYATLCYFCRIYDEIVSS